MYSSLAGNFHWHISYFPYNTNEAFKRVLDQLNSEYQVGNFFVVERVTQWSEGYYSEDQPYRWSAMFIAQIVSYSPVEGTFNIFTGKKKITKLPHLVVKAPDGTTFEALTFNDDGEYINAVPTDSTIKYLLKNTCVGEIAVEDFGLYSGQVCMSGVDRAKASGRFTAYNLQKEETAEKMKSEYQANMRRREAEAEIRRQKMEEQRKREAVAAESRDMFDKFFG